MSAAVVSTIREEQAAPSLVAPRLSLPSRRRTLILVVAAVLFLAGVALAARLVFHMGAIGIEIIDGPPTSLPSNAVTDADLGREVSFAQARPWRGSPRRSPRHWGHPIGSGSTKPRSTWSPERSRSASSPRGSPPRELPAIDGTNTGALSMQFEGGWEVAAEQLFAETDRYGDAIVEGRPAFWTTGAHTLTLVSGRESRRVLVTGNVLIWQDAGYTFRLETMLPRAQAIALAETVTPSIDLG